MSASFTPKDTGTTFGNVSGTPSVSLPGATTNTGAKPELPGTHPLPSAPTPLFWQDLGRILSDLAELYGQDPEAARKFGALVREELNKTKVK